MKIFFVLILLTLLNYTQTQENWKKYQYLKFQQNLFNNIYKLKSEEINETNFDEQYKKYFLKEGDELLDGNAEYLNPFKNDRNSEIKNYEQNFRNLEFQLVHNENKNIFKIYLYEDELLENKNNQKIENFQPQYKHLLLKIKNQFTSFTFKIQYSEFIPKSVREYQNQILNEKLEKFFQFIDGLDVIKNEINDLIQMKLKYSNNMISLKKSDEKFDANEKLQEFSKEEIKILNQSENTEGKLIRQNFEIEEIQKDENLKDLLGNQVDELEQEILNIIIQDQSWLCYKGSNQLLNFTLCLVYYLTKETSQPKISVFLTNNIFSKKIDFAFLTKRFIINQLDTFIDYIRDYQIEQFQSLTSEQNIYQQTSSEKIVKLYTEKQENSPYIFTEFVDNVMILTVSDINEQPIKEENIKFKSQWKFPSNSMYDEINYLESIFYNTQKMFTEKINESERLNRQFYLQKSDDKLSYKIDKQLCALKYLNDDEKEDQIWYSEAFDFGLHKEEKYIGISNTHSNTIQQKSDGESQDNPQIKDQIISENNTNKNSNEQVIKKESTKQKTINDGSVVDEEKLVQKESQSKTILKKKSSKIIRDDVSDEEILVQKDTQGKTIQKQVLKDTQGKTIQQKQPSNIKEDFSEQQRLSQAEIISNHEQIPNNSQIKSKQLSEDIEMILI